jgi:RNA polymerase sigma factor (sigma-70 family)
MTTKGSVTRFIDQLRSSDPTVRNEAARQIWMRYFPQLIDVARRQLDARVRGRRDDEEDVLIDVYKSLCLRMQKGEYQLDSRTDPWSLLVAMTHNKARKVGTRHTRQARDVRREQPATLAADSDFPHLAFERMESSDPTPSEAAILNEEFERRIGSLEEPLRQIALWKLEGYTNEEIAASDKLDCTVRTVERKLERIRKKWHR